MNSTKCEKLYKFAYDLTLGRTWSDLMVLCRHCLTPVHINIDIHFDILKMCWKPIQMM